MFSRAPARRVLTSSLPSSGTTITKFRPSTRPFSHIPPLSRSAKTAIVTGSARGIGRAIALRLARDGYNVTVNDVPAAQADIDSAVSEIQALGGGRKAYGHVADVSVAAEVNEMVAASVEELGPLSTMVANAGIATVKGVMDATTEVVRRLFDVNVLGVSHCYRAAAREFIRAKTPGKLLGCASVAAFRPMAHIGHYSASKFAVRGLTQAFALELAQHNITANAYAPGIVGTKMWEEIDAGIGKSTGAKAGATMAASVQGSIALKRASTAEDVAGLVSFLAGEDSGYVTGQTYLVDGGIFFT